MPSSKAASVGLNPSWPHFGCIVAVGLGLFAGLARYILSGEPQKRQRCNFRTKWNI
jgi:hypothetical protein